MGERLIESSLMKLLIEKFGQLYSETLGIDLRRGSDDEIFKWFFAAVLFGAPIKESSVIKTYKCFERHNLLSPNAILKAGWQGLVDVLDEGGYTRYDFKTADKLLAVMNTLLKEYGGSLNTLYEKSRNTRDLEQRLKSLGKGIGDVTISIFLREIRNTWRKTDSKPTSLVILAAKNLQITKGNMPEKVQKDLKNFWENNKIQHKTFSNFETALLKLGKDYCRKKRCNFCSLSAYCINVLQP